MIILKLIGIVAITLILILVTSWCLIAIGTGINERESDED